MKHKFTLGLFAGIMLSFAVAMVAFTVYTHNIGQGDEAIIPTPILTAVPSDGSDEGLSAEDYKKKTDNIKSLISRYFLYDVSEADYQEATYRALLDALDDPYSEYYSPPEYTSFTDSMSGEYCGIGALVSQNATTGVISIVKPFVDGPAYKTGVLPGDIIFKVEGEEVTGVDLTLVVSNMKGERGTTVNMEFVRPSDGDRHISYTITRDIIQVPTVEYELLGDGVGYISVMEFDTVTKDQYRSAIADLLAQGMTGLVVDLRNNPGGSLSTVCDMLDRILPKGTIVYTENKNGVEETYKSDDREIFDLPLAVLINGQSASASEIFAGAIQDYKVGTIVGTQSFGKGIVQTLLTLNDGSAIKITTSKYFTPNGRNIHGVGITPDIIVELDEDLQSLAVIPKEDDNQLQAAIEAVKDRK